MWIGVVEEQPCRVVNLTKEEQAKAPRQDVWPKMSAGIDVDIRPAGDIDAAKRTVLIERITQDDAHAPKKDVKFVC